MYLITVKSIYCHRLVRGIIFLPNILRQVIVVAWLVSMKMPLWPFHGLYYDIIRLSLPIKAMNLPENINYVAVHNV